MQRDSRSGGARGPDRTTSLLLGALAAQLTLTPLLLCTAVVEEFELPKAFFTSLCAIGWIATAALMAARRGITTATSCRTLDPTAWAVLLACAAAGVATLTSEWPSTSWNGAHNSFAGLWNTLSIAVLFFVGRRLVTNAARARLMLGWALAAALAAATYACLQVVGLDPFVWKGTSVFAGWARPFATLGHPSHLGGYLAMCLPIAVLFLGEALRTRRWRACVLLGMAALLIVVALLCSLARGAWLATAVSAGAAVVLLARQHPKRSLVLGGALLSLAALTAAAGLLWLPDAAVAGALSERIARLGESPRLVLWRAALRIFAEHPWLGSGLDTFQLAFVRVRPAALWAWEGQRAPTRAHSELIHILATQGLLGFATAAFFVTALCRAGARAWRSCGTEERALLATGGAVLGIYALHLTTGSSAVALSVLAAVLAGGLSGWAGQRATVDSTVAASLILQGDGPPSRGASAPAKVSAGDVVGRWMMRTLALGCLPLAALLVAQPLTAAVYARRGVEMTTRSPIEACANLAQATRLAPQNDFYWAKLGLAAEQFAATSPSIEQRQRLLSTALGAFERAVTLIAANPYHHANLGRLRGKLALLGAPRAEAYAAHDEALRLDPNNVDLLRQAAATALLLNDFERSDAYAERALAIVPTYAPALAHLGFVALARGQVERGESLLREALAADGFDDAPLERLAALVNLSAARLRLGRSADALAAAEEAVRLAPDSTQALHNRDLARATLDALNPSRQTTKTNAVPSAPLVNVTSPP